jgi:hypothetical protein
VTGGTSVNRSLAQAEVTSAAVKGIEGLPGAISNLCSTIAELKTAVESIAVQEETVEDKEEHSLFIACDEDDDSGDEGGEEETQTKKQRKMSGKDRVVGKGNKKKNL